MKLADLVFILAFLLTVFGVLRAVYLLLRRRVTDARRAASRLAVLLLAYFAVLLTVSVVSPADSHAMGTPWCFDDWCVSVDSVTAPAAIGTARPVHQWRIAWLTVRSTMRRGRQAEPDAYVFLLDRAGVRTYANAVGERALDDASPGRHRLTDPIDPESAFQVQTAFDVAPESGPFGLSKSRRSRFPGIFIIGDPESLLHRRPTVPLP